MRFSLRRATPEDAPAIADIHLRARRECMSYLPDIHSPEDVLVWIREIMPQHDEVWVAEGDGRVVGFFALSDNVLFHLYVYPELHRFQLWVFQRNTQAREFYEHRGMRVVELTDGSRNEEHEPDALYEWLPSPESA